MSFPCQPYHSSLDPTAHFALRQEHSEEVIYFITFMVISKLCIKEERVQDLKLHPASFWGLSHLPRHLAAQPTTLQGFRYHGKHLS